MKRFIPAILFAIFAFSMIVVVLQFAPIGDPHLPGYSEFVSPQMSKKAVIEKANSVVLYYNRYSSKDTGACDIITAIIFDYRGYDTLIETSVLFTALIGVLSIIGTKKEEE